MGERKVWIEFTYGQYRVMVEDNGTTPWQFYVTERFEDAMTQANHALGGPVVIDVRRP